MPHLWMSFVHRRLFECVCVCVCGMFFVSVWLPSSQVCHLLPLQVVPPCFITCPTLLPHNTLTNEPFGYSCSCESIFVYLCVWVGILGRMRCSFIITLSIFIVHTKHGSWPLQRYWQCSSLHCLSLSTSNITIRSASSQCSLLSSELCRRKILHKDPAYIIDCFPVTTI